MIILIATHVGQSLFGPQRPTLVTYTHQLAMEPGNPIRISWGVWSAKELLITCLETKNFLLENFFAEPEMASQIRDSSRSTRSPI